MNLTLFIITMYIVAVILIVVALNVIQNAKNKKYKTILDNLEIEKNVIDSTPILSEISKIKSILKNDKLEASFNEWQKQFEEIKNIKIPKITDMLLEAEYSLTQQDSQATIYKIAKLEMEI